MTAVDAASGALSQLLVLSLVVERASLVITFFMNTSSIKWSEEVPIPWTRGRVLLSFFIALLILYSADYDFVEKILVIDRSKMLFSPLFGMTLGAMVIAGGSSGIREIIGAIKAKLSEIQERRKQ